MTHRITDPLSEAEIQKALDIARRLIKAGVPVFAAPPDGANPGRFILPKEWQKTYPTEIWLDRWKPGWALAAVGGHLCDFLDVDPRSGGKESEREIQAAGQWPRSFGRQTTPSGGTHDIISATGERKVTGFMPGLDLQAGAPNGEGRGFVWISPTVRPSKDPDHLGQLTPYRWVEEPDLDHLMEYRTRRADGTWEVTDDTLEGLMSRVHAYRTRVPTQRERAAAQVDLEDPFATAASATGGGTSSGERTFTMAQAMDFVRPYLVDLQRAQVGSIEEKANTAATALSHFVPTFWTVDQGMALINDALSHTAYDPTGPYSSWRAEKFVRVLDGTRPPLDPWKAVLAPELDRTLFDPDAKPDAVPPPTSREEAMDMVDRLLAEMLTVDQVLSRPAPKPLIMDVLDLDSEAWLIGPPGSRKSFVALDLARCVASGTPWQGKKVRQGKVVYIVAEGATGFSLRVKAAREVHGDLGDLLVLPRPVQAKDPVAWEVLVAAVRRLEPVFILLDTQARVTVGLEENSATDMGIYVEAVRKLREATEACVLTVHHSGRNGTDARGSSAIDGAQGTELRVKVEGEKSALRGALVMDKQKDMAEAEGGIPLQFQVVELGTDPETGRRLSSLVLVEADPFAAQVYVEEPWEKELTGGRVQAQILRVLRDQGRSVGLTKAECRSNLEERFGAVQRTTYNTAWSRVLERTDKGGELIVGKVSGEKYAVVSLEILEGAAEPVTADSGGQG